MQSGIIHSTSSFDKRFYLLAIIAGALSVFAFAPFNVYLIAWITPAVLFYTLSNAKSNKQHFYLGWLFGIGYFAAGASWPFYSIYFFAHAPLVAAIIGVALFVIIVAFFTLGLFGLVAAQFKQLSLMSRLLFFYPATWVLFEWFRAWFLTGFPWLYLGNTQIDTVFAAYAPIFGVLGVSLICVMVAGAVLYLVHDRLSNNSLSFLPIAVIVLVTLCAFGLGKIDWTKKTGDPINVAVLQSNISQEEKLNPDNLQSMIDLYLEMTHQNPQSDLIVWPETALFATFNKHMESLILPLQKSLREKQVVLIGGFFINKDNAVENSVLAVSKNYRELYSKRHLVPFGEYIPLAKYIRWMGDWIPRSNISAGKPEKGTLQIIDQLAQMTICYEDAFGSEIIKSLPDATLLINVTHDGWFTGSFQPAQHMQIARMRSLETGRYMVRATTTGPAGIINEKGKVLATAKQYTQKVITHNVQAYTGATPYVRWGNWLIVSILTLATLLGIIINRKNKKHGNT